MINQFERDIINEYYSCFKKLEAKQMPKGVWEVKHCVGSVPDSRESTSMVVIGREVYLYGGYGRELFDDIRILTCNPNQSSWKWTLHSDLTNSNG